MDASIVLGLVGGAWALWYFVLSGFVPPRECPQLVALAAAWRADRRGDLVEEIRFTAADRDRAWQAVRAMAESGELNHLTSEVTEKHARLVKRYDALAARVVELYQQLNDCR
jgi:hypothetical protein